MLRKNTLLISKVHPETLRDIIYNLDDEYHNDDELINELDSLLIYYRDQWDIIEYLFNPHELNDDSFMAMFEYAISEARNCYVGEEE